MINGMLEKVIATFLLFAAAISAGPASAGSLRAGEYACAGSGGRILIGLGFILKSDDSYTDLDGKNAGRIVFGGTGLRFVGGHLDGQVGRNVRGGSNFEINMISCSHS